MQTKLQITGCVSSCASFSDNQRKRTIFFDGKWRKIGDRVHYDCAKGILKLFKFPIVFISVEACAQIQLPKWYMSSHDWKNAPEYERRVTIIGNTVCPSTDIPAYLK